MARNKKIFLFWFGLFLLTIFSFSFHSSSLEWNQDLGRHIRLGEITIKQRSVPQENLFSYTQENFPFQNHHWLSGVFFAVFYNNFGNDGLILIKTIFFLLAWGSLFWLICQKTPASWAAFLSLVPILVFRERTYIRPEIFGFLLFAIFLIIFTKARKGRENLLWFLPFLQILWINLHISFVFGLILIVANLVWFLQQSLFKKEKLRRKVLLPLVLSVVFNVVNPFGIRGVLWPFLIWQNYGYGIVENQSVFFLLGLGYRASIGFFLAGLTFGSVFLLKIKTKWSDLLVWLIISIVSLAQIRHFPFWALYSFWFWGNNISLLFKKTSTKTTLYFNQATTILSLLIFLFMITVYVFNLNYKATDVDRVFGFGGDQPGRKAALFLKENFSQRNIFNNFDIGSYLSYFYPEIRVFADSRPEAYSVDFWEEYRQIQASWPLWQEAVERYQIEAVFFSHTDQTPWGQQFLKNLYQNEGWQVVYLDQDIVVFSKKENTLPRLVFDESFVKSFSQTSLGFFRLGRLFSLFEKTELAKASFEEALRLNPDSYGANLGLASIYLQTENPALHFKAKGLISKTNSWWYRLW